MPRNKEGAQPFASLDSPCYSSPNNDLKRSLAYISGKTGSQWHESFYNVLCLVYPERRKTCWNNKPGFNPIWLPPPPFFFFSESLAFTAWSCLPQATAASGPTCFVQYRNLLLIYESLQTWGVQQKWLTKNIIAATNQSKRWLKSSSEIIPLSACCFSNANIQCAINLHWKQPILVLQMYVWKNATNEHVLLHRRDKSANPVFISVEQTWERSPAACCGVCHGMSSGTRLEDKGKMAAYGF